VRRPHLGGFRPAGSHVDCLDLAPGVDLETVREPTDAEVVLVPVEEEAS
jgi:hypothetical protein